MRVLAVGTAGASAGLVTRALVARGVAVRGLVHADDKAAAARANGADEVAVADLLDRAALAEALAGVDAVFHVIPAFAPDSEAAGVGLVEVAADAGVRRVVFSSVYHPSLTALANHRDKQPTEQALYEADLEYVVLQPSMFMSQLGGLVDRARSDGVVAGPYSATAPMAYVDYRDVAEVAAEAFVSDRFVDGTFELSGPGTFTREDVATLLAARLGREVRAEVVPPPVDDSMPEGLRTGLTRMFEHYDRHGFHGGNDLVLSTMLGRPAMSVPRYLEELTA